MHLREGRLTDLPSITDIATEALWNDEIVEFLAPHRTEHVESHRDTFLYRHRRRFFHGDRLIVAVTDEKDAAWTGQEIVTGFAFWSDTQGNSIKHPLPASALGNSFEQFILKVEGSYRWYLNIDRSYDKSQAAKFWKLVAQNPFFEDIGDHWELEVLAVRPGYQRQGLGSMLLEWGIEQASQHEAPVVVAATPRGERLYHKHGFEECGQIKFEEGNFRWTAMVWYPPTRAGNIRT